MTKLFKYTVTVFVTLILLTLFLLFRANSADIIIEQVLANDLSNQSTFSLNDIFEEQRTKEADWDNHVKYAFEGVLSNIEFHESLTRTEKEINLKMYEVASLYFNKDTLTSIPKEYSDPLFILALANVETGVWIGNNFGRIFSSAIPYATIENATPEMVVTYGIKEIMENDKYWDIIQPWYQHQGPLGISDGYGIGVAIKKEDLSGTEKDRTFNSLVRRYPNRSTDDFTYPRNSGDRFNWVDSVNRTAGKLNSNYKAYLNNKGATKDGQYAINNIYSFMAITSISHNTGLSVLVSFDGGNGGNYKNAGCARKYANFLGTPKIIKMITNEVERNLTTYRNSNSGYLSTRPSDTFSDKIYKLAIDEGQLDFDFYNVNGKNQKVHVYYPIQTLYNYVMLTNLYNGG